MVKNASLEGGYVVIMYTDLQELDKDLTVKWATGAAYCITSIVMKKIKELLMYTYIGRLYPSYK